MVSKYNKAFENRVKDYMYAIEKYPHVMNEEFESIIEELNLKNNDIILNIDGVASPIGKYIKNVTINYKILESNFAFSQYNNLEPFIYSNIPYENDSIDKIIINASLHHVSLLDREILYKEIYRVLRKDGIFVVNDVINYSKEDYMLNYIVNKYNPNGHNGIFFDEYDSKYFKNAGFNVITKIKEYKWKFYSKKEVIDFIKHLFHLTLIKDDEELYNIIKDHLQIKYDCNNNTYFFNWKLIFFICTK